MTCFEGPHRAMASPHRRQMLIGAAAAGLAACGRSKTMTVSTTPALDMKRLNAAGAEFAERARPGVIGMALVNLESGEAWSFNGARPFPMQSVSKAVLAAAALAEVDARRLSLDEPIVLGEEMLSPPYSPIAAAWPTRRDYTAQDLLSAAVGGSDNTAADVLMKRIGGPGAVKGWLDQSRVNEISIDRYEREIQVESVGLGSFRAAWRGAPAFAQEKGRVPPARRLQAMRRYLADPRDTATPRGMTTFLQRLYGGELISAASTERLLGAMAGTTSAPQRLSAGMPKGASLAHKTGTGPFDQGIMSVCNDVGLVTLKDRRVYAIAVFLAGAALDGAGCDRLIAELGAALMRGAR